MELSEKHCVPCEGLIPPMSDADEAKYIAQVKGWQLVREGTHKIRKEFKFKDFKGSMDFVNRVAAVAESEGHHPDIYIYYNRVVLELYTHAMKGLFDNDFILAAKIDNVLAKKTKKRKD
ncbi:MAG: 4a-hydroxytetrahydrobiopterin dehydratase [Candidatus Sigynarchaeota archaeon]